MITLLSKFFIKEDFSKNKIRQIYGSLCGSVGIFFNICLFLGKLLAGTLSGSIAITADAFNNLSDAGSSIVTLIGFKIATHKPDDDHPFGHGRYEYIAGLIVSFAIVLMGSELMINSVKKLIQPTNIESSPLTIGILVSSIAIKLYMAFYNYSVGKKIGSSTIYAVAIDSISDCFATSAVLLATLLSGRTALNVDAIAGILVSLFILYSGYKAAKETIGPLLGQAPTQEFVEQIHEIVLSCSNIIGIHDLIVHDYGPYHRMVSLHAEVPVDADLVEMHEKIDKIELRLKNELECNAIIHIDPIVTTDSHILKTRKKVEELVADLNIEFTIHDFRMIYDRTHTHILFDLAVPFAVDSSNETIIDQITSLIQSIGHGYQVSVTVDRV